MDSLRPVQELQDSESAVTCICFGQERQHRAYILLAAASKDGTVVIYRCYRARVRAAELRAIRDEKLAKDNAAALTIQKAWHRKRAYMRVRAKLRRIEEEKRRQLGLTLFM